MTVREWRMNFMDRGERLHVGDRDRERRRVQINLLKSLNRRDGARMRNSDRT